MIRDQILAHMTAYFHRYGTADNFLIMHTGLYPVDGSPTAILYSVWVLCRVVFLLVSLTERKDGCTITSTVFRNHISLISVNIARTAFPQFRLNQIFLLNRKTSTGEKLIDCCRWQLREPESEPYCGCKAIF
jgi:hypothetical protein